VPSAASYVRARRCGLLCGVVALVLAGPAAALNRDLELAENTVAVWSLRDGLTGSMVRSLVQTDEGYLWIAGFGGVTRYDGARIIRLDIEPPLDVMGTIPGPGGSLRIVPRRGPMVCTRRGAVAPCPADTPQLPPDARIFAIHATRDGDVYIATDAGLFRLHGNKLVRDAKAQAQLETLGELTAMHRDRKGRLWLAGSRGLFREDADRFTLIPEPGTELEVPARSFFETRAGKLWVLTERRLLLFDQELREEKSIPIPAELGVGWYSKIIEDRDGNLWLGGAKGLGRYRDGRFAIYTKSDGLPDDAVSALLEDREGTLWVGTQSGALAQFTDRTVSTKLGPPLLAEESIESVCEDAEGAMWFGNRLGLLRWKDGVQRLFTTADGLPTNRVYTAIPARAGGLWIGTAVGLARYHNGRIDRLMRETPQVFSLYEDSHGVLWLGTDHGLGRLVRDGSGEHMEAVATMGGFKPGQIRGFGEDDAGVMWVSSMGGLSSLVDGKLVPADPSLGADIVNADRGITRDFDGTLWLGTGSSLVGRRKGHFFSFAPALGPMRDWLFQVLPDDHGHLWFGTSRTIARAARSQLTEPERGRRSLPVITFDSTDTRREIAARRARNSGAWKARDGRLWFATLRGVVTIDPTRIRTNPLIPSVLIERTLVDGRQLTEDGATFPPGPGTIEFTYAGVTLLEPRKAAHRYRLEGFDREWVDAGTRRVAYYTNIPPGQYRFRVQASNADGVWNEAGASVALTLSPHFYQTAWFYALAVLGVGGMAFAFYRARLVRLRGQYLAVFAERSRVARELHDSLLQGMSAVALELANIRAALPGSATGPSQRLEAVEDALTQSLEETRRFVWNLREQPTGAGDLGLALTRLAGRLTEGHPVACPVEIEGTAVHLSHDVQGTFFRIAQEAITNALRHADAKVIAVDLRYRERQVELLVSDDGRGFDPAKAQGPEARHFGLVGMRERASRLHASLTIDSTPGAGTRVRFVFPTGPRTK
jgi:signal transduction histidine kinase/ligand-binding sensor domain-containing protein